MKRYRLIRELPTFQVSDEFFIAPDGSLWLDQKIDGEPNTSRVMAYNSRTLEKFPDILEDWFEPIDAPLIKNKKMRKALRAWAEANGVKEVRYLEFDDYSCFYGTYDNDECRLRFECRGKLEEVRLYRTYTVEALCGEMRNETKK